MTDTRDPHDLARFVEAQEGDYDRALAEVRAGRKRSHWMWSIFPQIDGLGSSSMSRRYAIRSLAEARAYFDHPVLGPRLGRDVRLRGYHAAMKARHERLARCPRLSA